MYVASLVKAVKLEEVGKSVKAVKAEEVESGADLS